MIWPLLFHQRSASVLSLDWPCPIFCLLGSLNRKLCEHSAKYQLLPYVLTLLFPVIKNNAISYSANLLSVSLPHTAPPPPPTTSFPSLQVLCSHIAERCKKQKQKTIWAQFRNIPFHNVCALWNDGLNPTAFFWCLVLFYLQMAMIARSLLTLCSVSR